jgi:hypothetical protein
MQVMASSNHARYQFSRDLTTYRLPINMRVEIEGISGVDLAIVRGLSGLLLWRSGSPRYCYYYRIGGCAHERGSLDSIVNPVGQPPAPCLAAAEFGFQAGHVLASNGK